VDKIRRYSDGNKSIRDILFVLVQNALFDDEGISIPELAQATEMGQSTVRIWLKKISNDIMIITQSGRMNVYRVNLDVMAQGE